MKETANGLPYPEDADAPDAPTQIKALAEAIDQIPSALIADLAVIEAKLGNASVATAKLIDLAVTTVKLANEAVTEAKLGNLAVATGKLQALAVTAAKLGNESVETGKLQALAVTAAKLAANAVETAKIKDGAVTPVKLASMGEVSIVGGEKLNPAPTRAVVTLYSPEDAPVKKMVPGVDGQLVTIIMDSKNGAFKITFKASTEEGGFKLASEFAGRTGDAITFAYDATAKRWIEVSRSDNA